MKEILNHEWSILCSRSILDKDTNNLSLINLIEQLNVPFQLDEGSAWDEEKGAEFPLEMVLVSRFRKLVSEEEVVSFETKVDFLSPDNVVIASFEQPLEMGHGMDNVRIRYGIGGLRLTKNGMYNFVIHYREKNSKDFMKIHTVPLKVTLTEIKN
jgi:hypothetical protein